jgi:DNA primase
MSIDTQQIQQQYKITEIMERYGFRPVQGTRKKFCCPLHDDHDPSFSVQDMSDGSQRFKCHASSCGKRGDVIQLVMELEGCNMPKAVEIITGQKPVTARPAPEKADKPKPTLATVRPNLGPWPKRRAQPDWKPGQTIYHINAAGKRGSLKPDLIHWYRDILGQIVAVTFRVKDTTKPDGKAVIPLRYSPDDDQWHRLGYVGDEPRPLYGAERLDGNELPVLVVEGEKVVDILQPHLKDRFVVVSWMGGTGAVEYADWKLLMDRKVILWPDFDHLKPKPDGSMPTVRTGQAAVEKAAAILEKCNVKALRILDLGDFTEAKYKSGWDAADALDPSDPNHMSVPQLLEFIKARTTKVGKDVAQAAPAAAPATNWLQGNRPVMTGGDNPSVKKDDPTNLWLLLKYNPQFAGRFTYDVFDQVILVDDQPMTGYRLRELRLEITQSRWPLQPKIKDLQDTVVALGLDNRTNRFARKLLALTWDRKKRLAPDSTTFAGETGSRGLLVDYANAEDTPFNRVIGMRWLVGAVQRIIQDPNSTKGWQHDSILVLEGDQGLRKTSFLRTLGDVFGQDAYTELQGSLGRDKDDLMKLRGKAIVELAEMTAHRKSDQDAFKAFIDKKVDEYRPPYGSEIIKQPRMVVFAGTTNKDTYLNDPTGARRFWPARVTAEIDTHLLRQDLEQIWAEAVVLAQAGEPNHLQDQELEWHLEAVDTRDQLEAWDGLFDTNLANNAALRKAEGLSMQEAFMLVNIMAATDMTVGATRRLEDMLTRKGYKYRQGDPRTPGQTARRLWRLTRGYSKKQKLAGGR